MYTLVRHEPRLFIIDLILNDNLSSVKKKL